MIKSFHLLSLIAGSVIICSSMASATDRIRNMSLSVEETNKQLATPQTPKNVGAGENFDDQMYFEDGGTLDNNTGNQPFDDMNAGRNPVVGTGGNAFPIPAPRRGGERGFINRFCDSAYRPQPAASAPQQDCMDSQRQQACERFSHAPVSVQKLLSQAVDCEANAANPTPYGCDGLDANRLDLLKQYWQDEDTSYTILFLPDLVLNSAENCTAANKRKTVK